MPKEEQLCPGETPGTRKTIKRTTKRADRRKAKKLDDAPTKRRYRGYSR